ncbi:putative F-box/FBD/LRR-repeat protein At4g13965 [Ricinus communis]|uniref:putative F-box/FBD/LRR-repeat protein At4g13965 n=1 Tax=Ricinus communis TaxID=3988 RepID=UPI00201AE889|nr:putative F-box/FBD/LRR-repeat protein At4g13965 [Ricinus communis]
MEANKRKGGMGKVKEDRISQLPDCLIHYIFSFMRTADVVRTCTLSKRWRFSSSGGTFHMLCTSASGATLHIDCFSPDQLIKLPIYFHNTASFTTLELCACSHSIDLPKSLGLPSLKNLHLVAFDVMDGNILST